MTAPGAAQAAGSARPAAAPQAAGAPAPAGDAADGFAAVLEDLLPGPPDPQAGAATGSAAQAVAADGPGAKQRDGACADPLAGLPAGWPQGLPLPLPAAAAGAAPGEAVAAGPTGGNAGSGSIGGGGGGGGRAAVLPPGIGPDPFSTPGAGDAAPPAGRAFQALLDTLSAAAGNPAERDTAAPPSGDAAVLPGMPALAPAPGLAPSNMPGAPSAPATHQATLASHPLDTGFAGEFSAEVRWMLDAGLQQAELHLHPADLGPIRIHLSLHAQGADISLAAAHATTREGLQQSLPALREMLAGQGLQLAQADVSGGSGQRFAGREPQPAPAPPAAAATGVGAPRAVRTGVATLRSGRGMLDLYA